jgi:2-succinyl-6-hydroxy-2,4-cyclohexadiene-1-carboxylate synthase
MPTVEANGLAFHVAERGAGEPLVLLHGFTGSSASWWPVADRLAECHRVLAIDLIGHGQSSAPGDPSRYSFELALDDLSAVARHLQIAPATWLGYSMGGRLALGLTLRDRQLVSALILESASPGIADAAERARRHDDDEAMALEIEQHGVEAFVAAWERRPLWNSQSSLASTARARQRAIRLRNRPAGLANSLRGMGQGAQPSLWSSLSEITAPTLIIAGALDAKFAAIAPRMADAMPSARVALAPEAGHAVHLEAPAFFSEQAMSFLARQARLVDVSR